MIAPLLLALTMQTTPPIPVDGGEDLDAKIGRMCQTITFPAVECLADNTCSSLDMELLKTGICYRYHYDTCLTDLQTCNGNNAFHEIIEPSEPIYVGPSIGEIIAGAAAFTVIGVGLGVLIVTAVQ